MEEFGTKKNGEWEEVENKISPPSFYFFVFVPTFSARTWTETLGTQASIVNWLRSLLNTLEKYSRQHKPVIQQNPAILAELVKRWSLEQESPQPDQYLESS